MTEPVPLFLLVIAVVVTALGAYLYASDLLQKERADHDATRTAVFMEVLRPNPSEVAPEARQRHRELVREALRYQAESLRPVGRRRRKAHREAEEILESRVTELVRERGYPPIA